MNALHENGAASLPAPQRDWRKMTRTIAHYERIEQIGEGTYGQVYRARCKDTDQIVALKKIRVHHGDYWGLPPTILREIKILKRLRHPNLVQMVEVVSSKGVEHLDDEDLPEEKHRVSKNDKIGDAREGYKGNLFLVLEYVSHDLTGLMDVAYRFKEVEIKSIFKQLLDALKYMHDNRFIHRDIKSSNILIDHHFRLKLADFGLARSIEPPILDRIHDRGNSQEFTNKVITLWYRPPELLLGATRYGTAVDIWSAGCILAELLLGKPLFCGKKEMEQLQLIFSMLGTPTPESWEGFQDLKLVRTKEVEIGAERKPRLREKYQDKIPLSALNLLEKLLELDPNKRLTAGRALNSRYFLLEPRAPERPEDLGTLQLEGGHFHEFQTKKKRKEAKRVAEQARLNALETGQSERDAQAEFDACYRSIMEKVAQEGLNADPAIETSESNKKDEQPFDEPEKERNEKPENKRSSREGEKDRERTDKTARNERKHAKDREREKSRRRLSNSEEEKRRKRKREEKEKGRDDEKKMHGSYAEAGNVNESSPVKEAKEVEANGSQHQTEHSNGEKGIDGESQETRGIKVSENVDSTQRKRDRSPDNKRSSRDEKRRSKSSRDRHKDRSSDSRHRSRDHELDRGRDRERHRRDGRDGDFDEVGRGDRDVYGRGPIGRPGYDRYHQQDRGNRNLSGLGRNAGEPGYDPERIRDWDHERHRRDRVIDEDSRHRAPPRGEPDFRENIGPRGTRDFRPPSGPHFREGAHLPPRVPEGMGAYGPSSIDFRSTPADQSRAAGPPGRFSDAGRHDRGRSPPRMGGRGRSPPRMGDRGLLEGGRYR